VKKQYFFGYLFVRGAKGLALLVILVGIGFCLLQYSQTNTAASAAAYQPSPNLQRALGKLRDAFSSTQHIVESFNADNRLTAPKVQGPRFPALIDSDADFARINDALSRVDQERQQLKQSIVSRFETSVKSIEEKLRAYAASLQSSSSPTPAAAPSPVPTATPLPSPTRQQESLFSSGLEADEADKRSAILFKRKEFLKVLGTKAENAENRARLSEAADQIDMLSKLLPEKSQASASAQLEPVSTPPNEPRAEQARKVFLSERIAQQLEQIRSEVRQTLLTSWILDDTFEQAIDVTSVEREKCRVSTLAQKGIWLSAVSRIGTGLLAAVLGSFLILVCADLVQTLLDNATHSGVVADAFNVLRGLARPASQNDSERSSSAPGSETRR
jgi:hypothetical protein